MTITHPGARLRELLRMDTPDALIAPGCYDGISAKLVEQAGYQAAYMSGLCVAATLGEPDVGVISVDAMVERVRIITRASSLPLIADADSGYGGAVNVAHATRAFEAAGAAAIHIEDQPFPKRCAAMSGKKLVPVAEMVARVKTALAARRDRDFMIIARTDALAVEGLEASIARLRAYEEAGADATMLMSVSSEEDMQRVTASMKMPTIVLMVEGLRPTVPANRLKQLGYPLVLYPVSLLQAQACIQARYLRQLRETGGTEAAAASMWSLARIAALLGLPAANATDEAFSRHAEEALVPTPRIGA
ncbi:isocitrate lyase/PEP mutase family protein [Achromobacter aloeverae]|uniref:Carboxyvinyl-carboxyphosphonate phosphorylmutase n=1 Tax=Achromobacter aloeverae TaxID=1750518 RepID=A0A4V1MRP7_9BURK|nr:isocitrate lyase/PEP mutase family protein [Achromobacter aloeverae]RXN85381.1 carboxyvinyl-carboxyphosphonate phosphorylmutase [Achromobacter aloeverae]